MKTAGFKEMIGGIAALAALSCGSSSNDLPSGQQDIGAASPNAVATKDFVAGIRLAHVDVTQTHSIDLWEIRPGNVLMIQNFDEANGDTRIEMGSEFLEAGSSYVGLYRRLKHDAGAPVSPELFAADQHIKHLPVRDASLPLPPNAPPQFPRQASEPTPLVGTGADPATLKVQDLPLPSSPYNYSTWDPTYCNTTPGIDGSWCPSGSWGTIRGNSYETIYWDAEAKNTQGSGGRSDEFTILQQLNGVWQSSPIYHLWLGAGRTVEATLFGGPAIYQANMTGASCAFAERWRLSFPQLIPPELPHPVKMASEFSNDIQGITHDPYNTIISRTEYSYNLFTGVATPQYGVIGAIVYNEDLQDYAPDRNEYKEPSSWIAQGFNHFGDIVYDPVTTDVFVSLSKKGGHGGIGVWGGVELPPVGPDPVVMMPVERS